MLFLLIEWFITLKNFSITIARNLKKIFIYLSIALLYTGVKYEYVTNSISFESHLNRFNWLKDWFPLILYKKTDFPEYRTWLELLHFYISLAQYFTALSVITVTFLCKASSNKFMTPPCSILPWQMYRQICSILQYQIFFIM